jgi:hypothetical protein
VQSIILAGNGKLYVPMPGDEQKALLCAAFDGVSYLSYLRSIVSDRLGEKGISGIRVPRRGGTWRARACVGS